MRRAVVDVGSNSVLLLVGEKTQDGWRTLFESSRVTGLGRGTKTSAMLSDQGMSDTLKELKQAYEVAADHGCEDVVAKATMAARIATNSQVFLDNALKQGTPVSILSGDEEARLGFLAVAEDPLFAREPRLTVIDVGGHSTELVNAAQTDMGWDTQFRRSFGTGALALREGPLKEDCAGVDARMSAMEIIDNTIGLRFLPGLTGRAVTLGATGTNLVTIRERITTWDPEKVHGAELDYEFISKATSWLSELGDDGRRQVPGIEAGREHTLHAGALILERCLFAAGAESCVVSVRGWRHGLLEEDTEY